MIIVKGRERQQETGEGGGAQRGARPPRKEQKGGTGAATFPPGKGTSWPEQVSPARAHAGGCWPRARGVRNKARSRHTDRALRLECGDIGDAAYLGQVLSLTFSG